MVVWEGVAPVVAALTKLFVSMFFFYTSRRMLVVFLIANFFLGQEGEVAFKVPDRCQNGFAVSPLCRTAREILCAALAKFMLVPVSFVSLSMCETKPQEFESANSSMASLATSNTVHSPPAKGLRKL